MRRTLFLYVSVLLLVSCSPGRIADLLKHQTPQPLGGQAASGSSLSPHPLSELEGGDFEAASSTSSLESSNGFSSSQRQLSLEERLTASGALELGKEDAPLLTIIINYSSPYSQEFHSTLFQRLVSDFLETGKVRIQMAMLPLKSYPEGSLQNATLYCATKQAKGLAMHSLLFSSHARSHAEMLGLAHSLKLNEKDFAACLDLPATAHVIENQGKALQTLGITRVPTFFFKETVFTGLPLYADLRGWIERLLPKDL